MIEDNISYLVDEYGDVGLYFRGCDETKLDQLRQLLLQIPLIRKELDSIPVEDILTDHCLTIDGATDVLFKIEKLLKGENIGKH